MLPLVTPSTSILSEPVSAWFLSILIWGPSSLLLHSKLTDRRPSLSLMLSFSSPPRPTPSSSESHSLASIFFTPKSITLTLRSSFFAAAHSRKGLSRHASEENTLFDATRLERRDALVRLFPLNYVEQNLDLYFSSN